MPAHPSTPASDRRIGLFMILAPLVLFATVSLAIATVVFAALGVAWLVYLVGIVPLVLSAFAIKFVLAPLRLWLALLEPHATLPHWVGQRASLGMTLAVPVAIAYSIATGRSDANATLMVVGDLALLAYVIASFFLLAAARQPRGASLTEPLERKLGAIVIVAAIVLVAWLARTNGTVKVGALFSNGLTNPVSLTNPGWGIHSCGLTSG